MKTIPLLFCAAAVVTMPVMAETQADSVHASIEKALNESAASWTAGDLKTFMQVYENSPTTRYIGSQGVTTGYAAIEEMYAKRFKKGDGASMGQLSLQLIDVKEMGSQYAFVVGRYFLKQDTGVTVSGITTLVFHKVGARWLIVADHSS
ncbi:YybH family protein [Dyella tabacisoli]|nr:DUF4440 domain-containing protein [Dyella tabacisoli]